MVVENQRKDYSSSDHAPKGQRVAADDYGYMPPAANDNGPGAIKTIRGQLDSMEAGAAGKGGGTNVIPEILMDMRRRNKPQK